MPRQAADIESFTDMTFDLRRETSQFMRLRQRARDQIAALADTLTELESLRYEIDGHIRRHRTGSPRS